MTTSPMSKATKRKSGEQSTVYNAEKLGHVVFIMIEDEDKSRAFYPGTISGYRILLQNKTDLGGGLTIEHLVEFEDGVKRWFDLAEEETGGRLQWKKKPSVASVDPTSAKKIRVCVGSPVDVGEFSGIAEQKEDNSITGTDSDEVICKSDDDNQNVAPILVQSSGPSSPGPIQNRAGQIRHLCLAPEIDQFVLVQDPAALHPTVSTLDHDSTDQRKCIHRQDKGVFSSDTSRDEPHPPLSQIHPLKPKLPTRHMVKSRDVGSALGGKERANRCIQPSLQLARQYAPSAVKLTNCLPLKPPIPSRFQGDIEQSMSETPEFSRLVNFSAHEQSLPDGMRCCVMCGEPRQYGGNRHIRGTEISIPHQNKGLCTRCDVNVWVVASSGLQIKWCKRCKNFRPWAAFGLKGGATKCAECREHQRQKYVSQKYGKS